MTTKQTKASATKAPKASNKMTKAAKATTAKRRAATKAPTPGVCSTCGFKLSDQRTRCRVATACAKRQQVAA